MSMAVKLRRAPARIAAGSFILNSGMGKLKGDDATAAAIHGMAVTAYPFVDVVTPKKFLRGLAVAEIAVGGALLLPIVPAAAAGAGLAAFSSGLLGLYWRTPGMHPDGDPRPTQQGIPIAKDIWLAAIAAGLLVDALIPDTEARRAVRRAERKLVKAQAKLAHVERRHTAAGELMELARAGRRNAASGAATGQLAARSAATGARAAVDSVQASLGSVQSAAVPSGVAALDAVKSATQSALDSASSIAAPLAQTVAAHAKSAVHASQDVLAH